MDFGDVIFFIVFVVIIIANIMKQVKKAQNKTTGKPEAETQPEKKSGWKSVLEQMLEEARKQMENKAEPESAGEPLKHPTGWEDIIPDKNPRKREMETQPGISKSGRTRQNPLIREASVRKVRERSKIPSETRYHKVDETEEMPIFMFHDDGPASRGKGIPRHLSVNGLRSAVVWSEILGTPVGLRDMEI